VIRANDPTEDQAVAAVSRLANIEGMPAVREAQAANGLYQAVQRLVSGVSRTGTAGSEKAVAMNDDRQLRLDLASWQSQ
jgi:hypothetical protein